MGRAVVVLKSRIIPVLLLKAGRMVKGRQFKDFRDTGDAVSAAKVYNHQDADELVFIDIEASRPGYKKNRAELYRVVEKVAEVCFMPLCVGGGVDSVEDAVQLIKIGADKVIINTAAVENPTLIQRVADTLGAQSVVVAVDVKKEEERYVIYTHCATQPRLDVVLEKYILGLELRGAGEVFINSIDCDGMMKGYDLSLLKLVRANTSMPVIACGGAGDFKHLVEAFQQTRVNAVACASLFHFGDNNPLRAKAYLKNYGISLKKI
ncbi:MAG: imidazole glycerol phosphate synthase cyclase subunit [Candidatus Omnitrophota bacterium]